LHREMVTQTRWFVGAIVGAIAATAGTVAAFTT
jgi:hypothetical protein